MSSLAKQVAYDRGQTIREAKIKEQHQTEHVVYKPGGCQLLGAVVTNHQRVGEAENDGAKLSDDDWYAEDKQLLVMMMSCYAFASDFNVFYLFFYHGCFC